MRVILTSLLAIFCLLLISCGGADDNCSDPNPPNPAKTYTVTFDGNGGTANILNITVNNGDSIDLSEITTYSATRAGYIFNGWFLAKSGGTALGLTAVTNNVTYYAQWTENPVNKYRITFDGNGGTPTVSSLNVDEGCSIDLTDFTATRTGYTFNGWFNAAIGGTQQNTIAVTTDVTLYAQWTQITFTVTFNGNGGTPNTTSITKNSGDTIDLSDVFTYIATRNGYSLNGWYTAISGGDPLSTVTVTGNVTYYAQWTQIPANNYTITFIGQGGTATPANIVVSSGSSVDLTTYTDTRAGYTFNGWFAASTGGSALTTVTVTADVTYYAQWTRDTFTVTFNGNGGTPNPTNITVNSGDTIDLSDIITYKATLTDHSLNGWYAAASGGAPLSTVTVTGNVTYYAQWTQNPPSNYTITFVGQGGTATPTNITVPADTEINLGNLSLYSDTMAGYTLNGWYDAPTGGTKYETVMVQDNIICYAQWTQDIYTVTFNGNGGSPAISSLDIPSGTTVDISANSYNATRTGYTFNGWFAAATGGTSLTSVTVNSNVTYYAQWTAIPNVTVTFDGNGGTATTTSLTITSGSSIDLSNLSIYNATRVGYTFNGWYLAASGGSPLITVTVNNNVTYYAQWSINFADMSFLPQIGGVASMAKRGDVLVTTMFYTSNGKDSLVVYTMDNTGNLNYTATLNGHTNYINSVVFLDDNTIVSGSSDQTIKVWVKSGTTWSDMTAATATLSANSLEIDAVAVLDENTIIGGYRDSNIRVWTKTAGSQWVNATAPAAVLAGHESWVYSLAALNKNSFVSGSGDIDGKILVWEKVDSAAWSTITLPTATLTGHTSWINSLLFWDANTIISASDDQKVKVWTKSGSWSNTATLNGHTAGVRSIAKLDGNTIVTGSEDNAVKVWKQSGTTWGDMTGSTATLTGHTDKVYPVVAWDADTILSGSLDKTIKTWKKQSLAWTDMTAATSTVTGHTQSINAIAVFDKNTITTGANDYTTKVWVKADANSWDSVTAPKATLTGQSATVRSIAMIDSDTVVSGYMNGNIAIWAKDSGNDWADMSAPTVTLAAHAAEVRSLAILDRNTIVSASADSKIKIWTKADSASWSTVSNPTQTLTGHTSAVGSVVSLDKNRFASGSSDKSVMVWVKADSDTWDSVTTPTATLTGNTGFVRTVSFMNEDTIVSGAADNKIMIWVKSGATWGDMSAPTATLTGHTAEVRTVVSLDNKTVVSRSTDDTIKIWVKSGASWVNMSAAAQSIAERTYSLFPYGSGVLYTNGMHIKYKNIIAQ